MKRNGLGNKPNAAQPLEEDEIEKIWSTGALGLQNLRSLLHLVWWNNVTHLGMRAFKEQYDCLIQDFTITNQYVEYKERQTKNRQGDEGGKVPESTRTKSGRRMEESGTHTEHSLSMSKGENVYFLTPLDKPTSNIWYKAVPVGRNTLAKMRQKIALVAFLDGKFKRPQNSHPKLWRRIQPT